MENTDAMPAFLIWSIVAFFGVITVIAVLVARTFSRYHRPVAEEQARAARLASTGLRVQGTVTAWATHPGGGENARSVRLQVAFPHDGSLLDAELVVTIDRGLIAGFAPGNVIHLLVDPEDPSQVAVDRTASIVEVPRG